MERCANCWQWTNALFARLCGHCYVQIFNKLPTVANDETTASDEKEEVLVVEEVPEEELLLDGEVPLCDDEDEAADVGTEEDHQ